MTRVLLFTITIVAFFAGIIFLLGYTTPKEYSGELTENFTERDIIVWKTITDVELNRSAKSDVKDLEIISGKDSFARWKELTNGGGFREYHISYRVEPTFLAIELVDSSSGLTGKWTYEIKSNAENGSSVVTIKEESVNTNIFNRGLQAIKGRDANLVKAMKTIRVGLFQNLLHSQ